MRYYFHFSILLENWTNKIVTVYKFSNILTRMRNSFREERVKHPMAFPTDRQLANHFGPFQMKNKEKFILYEYLILYYEYKWI